MKYRLLKEAALEELINEDWEGRSSEERRNDPYDSESPNGHHFAQRWFATASVSALLNVALGNADIPIELVRYYGGRKYVNEVAIDTLRRRSHEGDPEAKKALDIYRQKCDEELAGTDGTYRETPPLDWSVADSSYD